MVPAEFVKRAIPMQPDPMAELPDLVNEVLARHGSEILIHTLHSHPQCPKVTQTLPARIREALSKRTTAMLHAPVSSNAR